MISVAAGIIIRDGNVFLCRRRADGPYPLKWEFPGGKLEPGETPEECLRRELGEELGSATTIGPLYHRHSHAYPEAGTFDVSYYLVTSVSGPLRNRAFDRCQWVSLDDLPAFDILEGNRDVVAKLTTSYAPSATFTR